MKCTFNLLIYYSSTLTINHDAFGVLNQMLTLSQLSYNRPDSGRSKVLVKAFSKENHDFNLVIMSLWCSYMLQDKSEQDKESAPCQSVRLGTTEYQ